MNTSAILLACLTGEIGDRPRLSANAQGKADPLITPHEQYLRLGRDETTRYEAYRALFKAHLDEEMVSQIRSATNGNYALGSERFQKEIEIALGRRTRRGYAGRPANDITPDGMQGKLEL